MSSTFSKIALFIDGPNLYATAKTLGFDIDYKRMLKEFQSGGEMRSVGSGASAENIGGAVLASTNNG